MPALPPVPKVVRVGLHWKLAEDTGAVSHFHVSYTGTAPTPLQLNTFSSAVATAWATQFDALKQPNYSLVEVDSVDLSSALSAVGLDVSTHVGTRGGLPLDGAAQVHIQFNIARRYRGGKPGIFLPLGVANDLFDAQTWAAAFIGTVGTAWGNFETSTIGAGWAAAGTIAFVSVSYFSGFTVITNPITGRARNHPTPRVAPIIDPLIAFTVSQDFAHQRRRG